MNASANELFDRARRFLTHDMWSLRPGDGSFANAGVRLLQLAVMIGEGFVRDQLLLRASALTYMAALSLIPLLVVVFSILGGLGIGQQIALRAVDLLAGFAPDARDQMLALVQGAKLGALGTVGGAVVLITTVLTIRHAETAFNEIWGVRRGREWLRRLADYLLVIVVAPLLVGVAFSLEATLRSDPLVSRLLQVPLFDFLYRSGLQFMPLVLLIAAFAFLYWFLPNTRVRPLSALLGGALSACLLLVAQRMFVTFVVGAAKYDVLFGSFAALPLLLFWLYLAFGIILLGAEVSFAHQNLAQYRREVEGRSVGPAAREALGLQVAVEVARAFRERWPAPTADELSERLDAPVRSVHDLLQALAASGIVAELAGEERAGRFQLGAPADGICLDDVLRAVRGSREMGAEPESATAAAVQEVLQQVDGAVSETAGRLTLAELVARVGRTGRA